MAELMMEKKYKRVVVTGSFGFDYIMDLPGKFSDFIMPDQIHKLNIGLTVNSLVKQFGGTGANAAYGLALLGLKPYLVGVLGKDGRDYERHLKKSGVILDYVLRTKKLMTALGFVVTDQDGNQIWSYYPGALAELWKVKLDWLKKDDLMLLSPNNPKAFPIHLKQIIKTGAGLIFDPAFLIPNLTKSELAMGLKHAKIIIGNDYEINLMEKKTGTKLDSWLVGEKVVIRTLGAEGSEIFQGRNRWKIKAAKPKNISDPTGAGDAYRAGFIAGLVKGLDLETCGWMGSVCAAYTVEKYGTQTYKFTLNDFKKRYEMNYHSKLSYNL